MKALFWLSFGFFWPLFAWAADAVEVRIAVVLAKEQRAEEPTAPEVFSMERPPGHAGKHKEGHQKPAKRAASKESPPAQLEAADLRPMQKALGLRRHYAWLQRYSKQRASVDAKGHTVALPGGAQAHVRLQALKDGVATLVVSLPKTETVFQLGRTGSLYLQAGTHEDMEVWVVISPI